MALLQGLVARATKTRPLVLACLYVLTSALTDEDFSAKRLWWFCYPFHMRVRRERDGPRLCDDPERLPPREGPPRPPPPKEGRPPRCGAEENPPEECGRELGAEEKRRGPYPPLRGSSEEVSGGNARAGGSSGSAVIGTVFRINRSMSRISRF